MSFCSVSCPEAVFASLRSSDRLIKIKFKYLQKKLVKTTFQAAFAQLAVEVFPGVNSDDFIFDNLDFIDEPFPEAFQVNPFHGARAFAWANERIS